MDNPGNPVRRACDAFDQKQFQELAKNPAMIMELFDKLKAEAEANGNTGVDGGFWFRFDQKIGDSIVVQKENWAHFGDDSMLLLIQDYLGGLFEYHDYRNNPDKALSPGFAGVQSAVLNAADLGFEKCFEYLMNHINIENFDHDAICLAKALEHNSSNILVRILMNLKDESYPREDIYGFDGSLRRMIQPRIKESYKNSTISDEVYDALWVLRILKE